MTGKAAEHDVAPADVADVFVESLGSGIAAEHPLVKVPGVAGDRGRVDVAGIDEVEAGAEKPEVETTAAAEHADHPMSSHPRPW